MLFEARGVEYLADRFQLATSRHNPRVSHCCVRWPQLAGLARNLPFFPILFQCPVQVVAERFEDLLVAFRDGDPDGNGKVDTIPASGSEHLHYTWAAVLGAYGLPMYSLGAGRNGVGNYEESGEVYLQPVSPRYSLL